MLSGNKSIIKGGQWLYEIPYLQPGYFLEVFMIRGDEPVIFPQR
jgi:hypothetical protein